MKKHLLLTLLLSLCAISAFAAKAKPQTLKSPDGRIAVTFDSFKYSVSADGYQVLAPSAISMTLEDGTVWGGNAQLVKAIRKQKLSDNRFIPLLPWFSILTTVLYAVRIINI